MTLGCTMSLLNLGSTTRKHFSKEGLTELFFGISNKGVSVPYIIQIHGDEFLVFYFHFL